jgi:hypothetical protein
VEKARELREAARASIVVVAVFSLTATEIHDSKKTNGVSWGSSTCWLGLQ